MMVTTHAADTSCFFFTVGKTLTFYDKLLFICCSDLHFKYFPACIHIISSLKELSSSLWLQGVWQEKHFLSKHVFFFFHPDWLLFSVSHPSLYHSGPHLPFSPAHRASTDCQGTESCRTLSLHKKAWICCCQLQYCKTSYFTWTAVVLRFKIFRRFSFRSKSF